MKISISGFGGISPKTNPRYLDAGGAQIALNVEAYGEALKPLNGLSAAVATLTKSGTLQTIYRYGQDYTNDDKYWFHWAADVDVCRGQVPGDASEWTFYTGDGYPKATYNALALAGTSTQYPVTSRRLGLPAPTAALTATAVSLSLPTGSAKVTLNSYALDEIVGTFPLKIATSTNSGVTWTTATVTIATGSAPNTVATAINALANVAAATAGSSVVIATDAAGANVALKVQWGDASWQTRTANGTSTDPGTPTTRVYTYTFVAVESGITVESAPWASSNMSSATINAYADQLVTLTGFGTPPSGEGWYYSKVRIYRATAGEYLFVDEVPLPAVTYTDSKSAMDLGEVCPSLTWAPPVATLKGLINLPNGMMAGFSGRDIYFCDPYRPYTWPTAYMQTVDFPVVGLGRMDTSLAVLTQGAPYLMSGSSPGYVTVVKSDLEQACVSKRSIVSMGGTVFYASPDGLVALSASGSKVLTDAIFERSDWQALGPSTIRAYGHEDKYIAFHDPVTLDGVSYTGFVADLQSNQFIRHNIPNIVGGYTDLRNDQLYLVDTSKAVKKWGGGSALTGRWRSKVFSLPQITGFSCAQIEAEGYTGLTCAVYRDGVKLTTELTAGGDLVGALSAHRIEGRYPFRLAALQGRDWEVDLTVTQEVFNVVVAQAMAELGAPNGDAA
jgi:hypothetical protein